MKPIKEEEILEAKEKIKDFLKTNSKLKDLDDASLYVLCLMAQKELQTRQSNYRVRGTYRDLERI